MKPALINIEQVHIHSTEAKALPFAIVHAIGADAPIDPDAAPQFVKYLNDQPLPKDAENWNIVFDKTTGLMWPAEDIADVDWKQSKKACSDLTLGGFNDWFRPSLRQRLSIVNYSRISPALDTKFFRVPTSGWHWTDTEYADKAPSSYAWSVDLLNGGAYVNLQGYSGRVLACRRAARASQ
jgi:hypothetical protein